MGDRTESRGASPEATEKEVPRLVRGSVAGTLFRMAVPMLVGTFALNAFNLTDTWFVSRLGATELAAMSFSFPVVMLLNSIVFGIGMGGSSMISHALGQHDNEQARHLTTYTLVLAAGIVVLISGGGLLTINPLFRALGAGDEVMPLLSKYMVVWYSGVVFMVVPMMANNIIRSTGDTLSPSILMAIGCVGNIILDPIMIFGYFGCPALGIRGAALATVIARGLTFVLALWVLHGKHRLLLLEWPRLRDMFAAWRKVLSIGLPASLSNILMPLSGAVITRIVSRFGTAAVAACGAAGRLEMFAFLIPMCLGMSLVPFIGQNFGAKRLDRVYTAYKQSIGFAFLFGILTCAMFIIFAPQFAAVFARDKDPLVEAEVARILVRYLRIVCLGHGLIEVHRYSTFFLNALHKPMQATSVNMIRILFLLVPLSFLGAQFFGLNGLFAGRAITDIAAGIIGAVWVLFVLKKLQNAAVPDGLSQAA